MQPSAIVALKEDFPPPPSNSLIYSEADQDFALAPRARTASMS
jgi:hypothetical protein